MKKVLHHCAGHQVSPWKFDAAELRKGEATPDYADWLRGDGLDTADTKDQVGRWAETCASCRSSDGCGTG